jgi:Arc/MetJ family transcription regulator
MIKRTTIEIDDDLLNRAKEALGEVTARATVEEALRRVATGTETERERRAAKQRRYLEQLSVRVDVAVLASGTRGDARRP